MTTKTELEEENLRLRTQVESLQEEVAQAKQAHRDHKALIREVAAKYTHIHGWCDVVNAALKEAKLETEFKRIQVKVDMPMEMLLEVDAEAFDDLDEEAKKEYLRSALQRTGNVTIASRSESALRVPRQPVVGIGQNVEIIEAAQGSIEHGAPTGYLARYVSANGRVLHFYPEHAVNGGGIWAYSMCGTSMGSVRELTETSERGEDRVCGNCQNRAYNL